MTTDKQDALMRLQLASTGEDIIVNPLHLVAAMPATEAVHKDSLPEAARSAVLVSGGLSYLLRNTVDEVQDELRRSIDIGLHS